MPYLRFYRFFPALRISTSDDQCPSSSSPVLSPLPAPTPSPLRARFSALLSNLSHPRQHLQQSPAAKTVHWGATTEIPPSPVPISPIPLSEIEVESKPEPNREKEQEDSPQSQPQTPKPAPKPIIKPPIPLDHEMLHKNMWEMVKQAEEKVRLNHEYLDVAGDDVLDSWFRVEERSMHRSANRAAKDKHDSMVAMGIRRPRVAKRKKRAAAKARRGVKRCVSRCVSLEKEVDAGPKLSRVK